MGTHRIQDSFQAKTSKCEMRASREEQASSLQQSRLMAIHLFITFNFAEHVCD